MMAPTQSRAIAAPLNADPPTEPNGQAPNAIKEIMDPPFVRGPAWFWDLFLVSLLGALMGALSMPYMLLVDGIPDLWLKRASNSGDFPDGAASYGFCGGSPLWIAICAVAFTAVGLLKLAMGLDEYPSFLTEMKHQDVHTKISAKICVCCVASLCAGATLGPEAGLGASGAALGQLFAKLAPKRWVEDPEQADFRRRTFVLCGMAAAFGAILPAPIVAVVLVGEVANAGSEQVSRPGEFLAGLSLAKKTFVFLVPASTIAFAVRSSFVELPTFEHPGALVPYNKWEPLLGVFLGVVAALAGIIFIALGAIVKLPCMALAKRLERCCGKAARQVLMASVAGVVVGLCIFSFPLCIGSGRMMMAVLLKHSENLSTGVILASVFVKGLAYWTCASGGLVGGIFFPLMFYGLLVGELAHRYVGVSHDLAASVMLGAVPASFMTAPFTMLIMPVAFFASGPLHTVAIFAAVVTSNTLLVGSGLLQKVLP